MKLFNMFKKWFGCFQVSKKPKNDEDVHLQSTDNETDYEDNGIVVEYPDSDDEIVSENIEEYKSYVIGPYSDNDNVSSEHQPKINIEYEENDLSLRQENNEQISLYVQQNQNMVSSFHEEENSMDRQLNEILECSGYVMKETKKERTGLMEYNEKILNIEDILKF